MLFTPDGSMGAHSVSSCKPDSTALDPRHARQPVLIVDDEIRAEDALVRLLAFEGFDVVCTTSGVDALSRVRSTPFDAMVLDLHLPDMLGLMVLSELRRGGVAVPVVAVTGWYGENRHEEACLALGAGAFLRKPLDESVLAATLRGVIAAHATPPPPPTPARMYCRQPSVCRPGIGSPADNEDRLRMHHERALCGDDTAADCIVADLLPSLRKRLRPAFLMTPKDWIHDAVVDALLEYRSRPARYEASRGMTLTGYLLFAARRNLLNRLDSEARRGRHETIASADSVPEPALAAPPLVPPSNDLPMAIAIPENDFTEPERLVLQLWRAGERRTTVYAKALGLDSLPFSEQCVRVKRIKDCVVQRVRRWVRRGGGTDAKG